MVGCTVSGNGCDAMETVQPRLLQEVGVDHLCVLDLKIIPQLNTENRNERLHRVLRHVKDDDRQLATVQTHVVSGQRQNHCPELFLLAVGQVESVPILCELLRDPGCVGELRPAVLARLEQLAYPDFAQATVSAGSAADPLRALSLPALQL